MDKSPADVKSFYDEFLMERMVRYRLGDNLRINKAVEFINSHVRSSDVVVDIGCGIGIATEAAARVANQGRVFGCDISEKNIWYASRTISLPNINFLELDILTAPETLESRVGTKVDVFILSDVIEHFPEKTRAGIFEIMARMGSRTMKILLTYPTPAYQDYLRANNPGELQVVDENIELSQLCSEAGKCGLAITFFALRDVWRPGQYVHAVIERSETVGAAVANRYPNPKRAPLINRIIKKAKRRSMRKRYFDAIFGR